MKKFFLFKNITIKQANILTVAIIFLFSLIFVTLLVEEMYKDYKSALHATLKHNDSTLTTKTVMENKQQLKYILIKTVLAIITLSFIIFAIALGFYNIMSAILQKDTEKFLEFFERATHEEAYLQPKEIFFKDFKMMATHANKMVQTISKQKKSLRELNLNLEQRVKEKTKSLQIINENLIKEKSFSEEILNHQKEFLRYTVHETNTPLSVILTSIELYNMSNKKDRQLSKIEAAVKNIFSIYDDLSYLVKKDQIDYPKNVINIKKYIESRVDFFREVAEHALIELKYIAKVDDAHIYFNETKLQRIVDNNLTNAIKYTLANQVAVIGLQKIGTSIEFSVGSKSKTIENTKKVFEAYYREGESLQRRDGFGIGLRLVRNICDEENVAINLRSDDDYTEFRYLFKMMGD